MAFLTLFQFLLFLLLKKQEKHLLCFGLLPEHFHLQNLVKKILTFKALVKCHRKEKAYTAFCPTSPSLYSCPWQDEISEMNHVLSPLLSKS